MRKILGVLVLSLAFVGSFSGAARADRDDWHHGRGWGRYHNDHRWRVRHHVWDRDDRVIVAGRDWNVRIVSARPSRPSTIVHVVPQPVTYVPAYAAPVAMGSVIAAPASPTFVDTIGRTCREYQSTVMVNGYAQPAYGTACLSPDGSWRITQ